MPLNILHCTGQPPTTKYPALKVSSAEAEESCVDEDKAGPTSICSGRGFISSSICSTNTY